MFNCLSFNDFKRNYKKSPEIQEFSNWKTKKLRLYDVVIEEYTMEQKKEIHLPQDEIL